jgi:hypothetical protein
MSTEVEAEAVGREARTCSVVLLRKACIAHVRAVNLSTQAVSRWACMRKRTAQTARRGTDRAGRGGAFALIALERVVAFPADCDSRFRLPRFTGNAV